MCVRVYVCTRALSVGTVALAGLSNGYLKLTNDAWQAASGAGPANECHHAAAGIQLLQQCALLGPDSTGSRALAERVGALILATDMAQHKQILADFEGKCATAEDTAANKGLVMKLLLKVSDLGHVFAPWAVHERWATQLEEEFWRQGEVRAGAPPPLA